ncbi:uncharacterized protein DEA37_0002377 [Paragonimus westermani]|uniref:Histone-lysine N-methyltransferase n=1 Tax=Paragonimus westermani TaxID=34504 RepID=A0A5J4NVB1_9TREM|nr:uncharacterized protein DEA37_0002377 [Paragonimus westermani]
MPSATALGHFEVATAISNSPFLVTPDNSLKASKQAVESENIVPTENGLPGDITIKDTSCFLSESPTCTTVLTSLNGYWKQSVLGEPVNCEVLEEFSEPPSPTVSSATDEEEEEPRSKNQPRLRKNEPISSTDEDSGDDGPRNVPSQLFKTPKSTPMNGVESRVHRFQGNLSLVKYARMRAERAKLLASQNKNKKKILSFFGNKSKISELFADKRQPWNVGELVWARPKHPVALPWWPAIIVQRPRKLNAQTIRMLFTSAVYFILLLFSKCSQLIICLLRMYVFTESQVLRGSFTNHVPEFRVCLLGPIRPESLLSVSQTRLRLYSGRDEFDKFMRESVMQSENKIRTLCQFVIQPNLQPAWQLAREIAEAARLNKPDTGGRLALFPWATESKFRELTSNQMTARPTHFSVFPRQRKRALRETYDNGLSSSSDDPDHSDTDTSEPGSEDPYAISSSASTTSTGPSGRRRLKLRKLARAGRGPGVSDSDNLVSETKNRNGFSLKDLATCFEYEKLRFAHIIPRRIFVCSVCGGAGEQLVSSNLSHSEPDPLSAQNVPPGDPASSVDSAQYPLITACVGGCGNYVHPNCARTIEITPVSKIKQVATTPDLSNQDQSEVGSSIVAANVGTVSEPDRSTEPQMPRLASACELCISGFRRCSICHLTQPCVRPWTLTATLSVDSSFPAVAEEMSHSSLAAPLPEFINNTPTDASESVETPSSLVADMPKSVLKDQMIRCSVKSCLRWYHPSCLRKPPFNALVRDRKAGAFSCPAHTCLTCSVETPGTLPRPTARYICCFLCPAAYHPGEWCLPAGSKEVPDKFVCEDCMNGRFPRYGEIVWARLPPNLNSAKRGSTTFGDNVKPAPADYASLTVGMYWWPGEVVHPRHLPAGSSHLTAITDGTAYQAVLSEDSMHHTAADEHSLGLFPIRLFGLTTPAQPSSDEGHSNQSLLLPVVLWTTRARLFPYEEGDDKRDGNSSSDSSSSDGERGARRRRSSCQDDGEDEDPLLQLGTVIDASSKENQQPSVSPSKQDATLCAAAPKSPGTKSPNLRTRFDRRQRLRPLKDGTANREVSDNSCSKVNPALIARRKQVYSDAVKQAADGWLGRREKFGQLLGRTRRPDYYKPIKVNWPLGSVRIYRLTDTSEAPRCECKPEAGVAPCGPLSNCINRELHYECLPSVCPNGEACQNQRFTKRLYPAQRPFWTGSERGWGLKTLTPIQEGEFVNEYIGDLIDEEEANRRLRFAHENNVTNYYMMKLDSQRIIDAGPKGNLSRFMNHSCDPNLNTQKWTVNGDNRIGLFAVREIAAGEELTFNYNFVALGQERLHCRCGASNCVGFLGASTTTNGSHANPRAGDDEAATTSHTSRMRRHDGTGGATDGSNGADSTGGKSSTGWSNASALNGRTAQLSELALVREERHERVCYRCAQSVPPAKASLMVEADGELEEPKFIELPIKMRQPSKRGLKRELEELVADAVHCSPVKEPSFRPVVGTSERPAYVTDETAAVTAPNENALMDKSETAILIHCTKPDCPKVYHLQCLDLDSPPVGRWFCPWHHCDACGRPSHIFCCLCPASFCLAHVEGSIAILPPSVITAKSATTRRLCKSDRKSKNQSGAVEKHSIGDSRLLARVVCQSHSDLIRETMEQLMKKPTVVSASIRKPLSSLDVPSNTSAQPNHVRTRQSEPKSTPRPMRPPPPISFAKRGRFLSLRPLHTSACSARARSLNTYALELKTRFGPTLRRHRSTVPVTNQAGSSTAVASKA